MNSSLIYRTKSQAAKVIIRGTLVLVGLGLALQLILMFFALRGGRTDINSSYVISMAMMCIGTYISLKCLDKSLKLALYLYISTATINISAMTIEHFATPKAVMNIPLVLFGLDIAVFILGLILGLRPALVYAGIITFLCFLLGMWFGDLAFDIVPIVFFAYLMTLPSWLVEQLEKNIVQSEQKFALVFQDSLDVILIIEKITGLVLNVNRATTEILHYEAQHVIGQNLAILFPSNTPLTADALLEKLTTQNAVLGSQPFLRADGTHCPMDVTATNMQWGEQPAILLTLRDITERKQAEEEIQRYQEHLQDLVTERTHELTQTNTELRTSNEELNAFAHTVAHDLKNPLSVLIGFGELLHHRFYKMEPKQRQYISSAIIQTGYKMTNIIDELLLLSSIRQADQIELQPVAMDKVVQNALQRITNLITDHNPEITVSEQWPTIWGYAPWIEEIWVNYISNAIKYGGNSEQNIPPKIMIGYDSNVPIEKQEFAPHLIRFGVCDNGLGLTPAEQACLFTPFTRLNQVRARGHGLGLSIVKRIVDKLGGETSITSEVGTGSTFYFTLPINAPDERLAA